VGEAQRRLADCRGRHRDRQDRFELSLIDALDQLLQRMLPDLEQETLAQIAEHSGIALDLDMAEDMKRDRERCLKELEAIDSDPLYRSRETSLCPSTGELDADLAELQVHHSALQPVLKTCFKDPRFPELLASGYGTPKYSKPFWRLAYHVDRAAAKEIEQACGGRPFAEIRQDVISALEASSILEQRIEDLQKRRKEIERLCSRRSQLKKKLQRHEEIWLDSVRWQIRRELEKDPDAYFESLLSVEAWSEELSRWRVLLELVEEHRRLKEDSLVEAAAALSDSDASKAHRLLDEYEAREASLLRFERPEALEGAIDWKAFFYGSSR